MSLRTVSEILDHSEQQGEAFLLLLIIANNVDAYDRAEALSIDALAREAHLERDAVICALRKLESSGDVRIERDVTQNGNGTFSLRLDGRSHSVRKVTPPVQAVGSPAEARA